MLGHGPPSTRIVIYPYLLQVSSEHGLRNNKVLFLDHPFDWIFVKEPFQSGANEYHVIPLILQCKAYLYENTGAINKMFL